MTIIGITPSFLRYSNKLSPQSAPRKLCSFIRPCVFCLLITCTQCCISTSLYFTPTPVQNFSWVELPSWSFEATSIKSISTSVTRDRTWISLNVLSCMLSRTWRGIKVSASSWSWFLKSSWMGWGELIFTTVLKATFTFFIDPLLDYLRKDGLITIFHLMVTIP